MPNPQTASFYSPGFDYSADISEIERRKKLAEALQSQADLPLQGQVAPGGYAVPISPWQGLAKVATQYNANKQAESAEKKQRELSERAQRELTGVLRQGSEAYTGRPARTIAPDPQEAQQSADQGTPEVAPVNQPGVAPDLNKAAMIYLSHPQTAPLGMNMAQQDITTKQQLARALAATGVDTGGGATSVAASPGAAPAAQPGGTMPASLQQSPPASPQAGAQAPQGAQGQFDRNGVPLDFSKSLQVSDPTLGKYWDYVKQLREPKMSANGQVMQYQQLPNGGWGYAPGAGAVEAARAFADVGEKAKADQDIIEVKVEGRPVQMTRSEAVRRFGQQAQTVPAVTPTQAPQAPQTGFQRVGQVPQQDEAALRFVEQQAAKGIPASAYGGQPQQQQPQAGFGVGQTPGEKKFEEGSAENATKYRASLNDRVATGQDLMMRIGESEGLLKQFQAGGGQGVRVQLAQMAQAVGAPQSTVDGIARGDLGSAQAFQKIVVSQAMEALKQAMATTGGTGAGRITQAEFQIFMKANPNLELDPRALEKIYGFARKVHGRDYAEQQAFQTWIDEKKDPAGFQPSWSQQIHNRGVKDIVGSGQADPLGLRGNNR